MRLDAKYVVNQYLNPGEKLLWYGRPKTGIVFRKSDLFIIPFSLLWCGFAIAWVYLAADNGAPLIFVLFGMPFVLIGLILVFGRFFLDAWSREKTYYGITENRVIQVTSFMRQKHRSFDLYPGLQIGIDEKQDGYGSILLGPTKMNGFQAEGIGWWPSSGKHKSGKPMMQLSLIPNVRKVYNTLRKESRLSAAWMS